MKLYELTNEYQAVLDMSEDDGIPADAITDTLEAISAEIEVKADNIACLLKSLDFDIKGIKEEEAHLAERRHKKQATYDRIKQYLAEELLKAGIAKVETARSVISFRKSETVEISDEKAFLEWAMNNDDDYIIYSSPKPDKTAIKAAIKGGADIVGAQISEKQNIQIK